MTPALSLYVFAAGRAEPIALGGAQGSFRPAPRRGDAPDLVWIHTEHGEPGCAATALADRIVEDRPRTDVVFSAEDPPDDKGDRVWVRRPPDFPRAASAFLQDCRPGAIVWIGGPIRPVIAVKAHQAGIPMVLANAAPDHARGRRGVPARDLLRLFDLVVGAAGDVSPLAELAGERVAPLGRLQRSVETFEYHTADHTRLLASLKARPVWFAADAVRGEIDDLRRAHAQCQGASHRLLLILRPHDPSECAAALDGLATRSETGVPPEASPIFVADTPGEDGLWYRLAATSFLGGTLRGPRATAHPLRPAALGSAIVHGPHHAPYSEGFAALDRAGAALQVTDADGLARAVSELLAPDRAADLAYRAWSVASEGAEATDHVAATVCRLLDEHA
jgi:3-deoxy-D-manno-octulosonic-acid transferase